MRQRKRQKKRLKKLHPSDMNTRRILEELDKHAAEFNFPLLDNAYVEFGTARLSAFQNAQDWLVAFEVLGFSTKEFVFVDDLYGYGSCVERAGFIGAEVPLTSSEEEPLFDAETNECIADWSHWSIKVCGEKMSFSPTREEYAQSGIRIDPSTGPGSVREIELLRFLLDRLGQNRLFMSDQALLSHFPKCRKLSKFIQTTEWQHPDVADGEKPSTSISIRSLMAALSREDVSLFKPGRPNTHWRFWVQAA
jgi:hypothetical protein